MTLRAYTINRLGSGGGSITINANSAFTYDVPTGQTHNFQVNSVSILEIANTGITASSADFGDKATAEDKLRIAGQTSPLGPIMTALNDDGTLLRPLVMDALSYALRTSGTNAVTITSGGDVGIPGTLTMQGGFAVGSSDVLNDVKNRLQFLGAVGTPRGFIQSSELALGDLVLHSQGNGDIRLDPAGTGNTTISSGGLTIQAGDLLATGLPGSPGRFAMSSIDLAVVADQVIGQIDFIGFDLSGAGPGPRAGLNIEAIDAISGTYRINLLADDGAGRVDAGTFAGASVGATLPGPLAVAGNVNAQADLVVTGEILSPTSAGGMFLSGDTTTATGANIVLRGGGFSGAPGDMLFRAATTERLAWDQSEAKWTMTGDFDLTGGFVASGTGPHTFAGTSIFGSGNPVIHSGVTPSLSIQGNDANARLSGMTFFNTGNSGPIWSFAKSAAGGETLAYPNLNDNLGGIWWHGADPTVGRFNPSAKQFVEAASQWTASNFHTRMIFEVTPSGSTAITEILRLEDATATITGDLAVTGAFGIFGQTPAAQTAAYTPTNVTTVRSFNANSTTIDQLADVLGTLIADFQGFGHLG